MNWDDLPYLLAVVRGGGLSEAARLRNVSPSTVSRHIERLEKDLQQKLFSHGHDGYRPNALCKRLLSEAEFIETQIDALQRSAAADPDKPQGTVRISTPELLGNEIIIPALPVFHADYPHISLELIADVRQVRLTRREADVVLRVVRPTEGDYKMRKIGEVTAGLFGSRDYLRSYGQPREPQDLRVHNIISWDHEFDSLVMVGWLTDLIGEHKPWLRTTSYSAQLRACQAGLGVAVLPSEIGMRAGLHPVLSNLPPLKLDLWLLLSSAVATEKRVEHVADFLSKLFAA